MMRELWYIATHDVFSAWMLGVAAFHVLAALVAVITLRQSLRVQRAAIRQQGAIWRIKQRQREGGCHE